MATFTGYPGASGDDGYGKEDTEFDNSSAGMQVIFDDTSMEKDLLFIRFPNITIAQGATVSDAELTVWANANVSSNFDVKFWAHDVDNATAPADETELYGSSSFSGALTTAYETTDPFNEGSLSAGDEITVEDLGPIIQEIVNRGSWASGNALIIYATYAGDESETQSWPIRTYDYTGSTYNPKLVITYTAPAGSDAVPMALNTYQQMRNK